MLYIVFVSCMGRWATDLRVFNASGALMEAPRSPCRSTLWRDLVSARECLNGQFRSQVFAGARLFHSLELKYVRRLRI